MDLLPARTASPPSAADEAELGAHLARFQSNGFTIIRDVLEPALIRELRAALDAAVARKMQATNPEGQALAEVAAA